MELAKRLKKAIDYRQISQNKLAQIAGVKQATIWKLLNGVTKSSGKMVNIANALNVDPNWLATGQGDMILPAEAPLDYEGLFPVEMYDEQGNKTGRRIMVPDLVESGFCKAYRLAQNSGLSELPASTIIVVNSKLIPFQDDYVYAEVNGIRSAYRYVSGGAKGYLSVDDRRIPLIEITDNLNLLGVIVSFTRGLRK
ncbi:helix-turn-helix transcriptional regulator [Salmonella enterica subsp. enterica]|nr:XRE family transcriptional regulator [Salmonella enterica subsp. enterica serovar Agbeni]EBY6475830.1 XRE family transcriptional regulator [Salmonella enterica subsp. enterica serovar Hessarek]ECQ1752816.1 helix-turn-helix transcriptional regulator [Salmonella enterica subsp. enterica serovar Malstatt]EEP8101325.1 helix-turn-helix transcriptional regulator [Salmonella enterica subsp. enterica]